MTDKLIIFDTTLRDGEQCPGATMTFEEKLQVAEILDDMGVDVIEAGFPIASDGDFESVTEIAKLAKNSVICGLARANPADIDRAGEAIKASPNSLSAQLVRARALLARGDSRQAQEILESILARDPVYMPALRLLVNLRIREGKAAEALQRISQLAKSHPRNGDLHALLVIAVDDHLEAFEGAKRFLQRRQDVGHVLQRGPFWGHHQQHRVRVLQRPPVQAHIEVRPHVNDPKLVEAAGLA